MWASGGRRAEELARVGLAGLFPAALGEAFGGIRKGWLRAPYGV